HSTRYVCVLGVVVSSMSLPSFPTRRSSDLAALRGLGQEIGFVGRLFGGELDQHHVQAAGHVVGPLAEKLEVHQSDERGMQRNGQDRKSTRLNSSHVSISYAVFCLKKKSNLSTTIGKDYVFWQGKNMREKM